MNAAAPLAEVLARPDVWRGDHVASAALPGVPSGFAALDAELPGGGWPRGALTEVLLDGVGLGEISLLMPALLHVKEMGGWSLLVAPPHPLHAPAWAAAGADLARLAVVSPVQRRDGLWAAEQALSSGAPTAVMCWAVQIDSRQVRRLQVAAAGGNALAFLFRPARAAAESSVAPLRLVLSPGPRGALGVGLLKRRGPPCHRTVYLDLPQPARWRDNHESAVAGSPSAASSARSQRPAVVA